MEPIEARLVSSNVADALCALARQLRTEQNLRVNSLVADIGDTGLAVRVTAAGICA
jgi:exoribonuclease II